MPKASITLPVTMRADLIERLQSRAFTNGDAMATTILKAVEQYLDECDAWEASRQRRAG